MPGFQSIIGQHFPVRVLQFFLRTGKIPHALLFTGVEGIGKRTAAVLFAQALNCDTPADAGAPEKSGSADRPCGQCRSCRQIQEGHHPDIIAVAPRKGMLRIDQVRDLIQTLTLKPFRAQFRVVILSDAHTMNAEAGNALLKILEEPPAGTLVILTAAQRADLLPTIASRCRHIRFSPLSIDDLAALLISRCAMEPEQARILGRMSDGSFTRALRLAQSHWSEHRDWMVCAAGLERPASAQGRSMALALAFAGELAAHRERITSDLELLKTWIRDLGVWRHCPGHIIHRDRGEMLQSMSAHLSDSQVTRLWDAVESAQKAVAGNSNLRLTLDVMALQMAEVTAA